MHMGFKFVLKEILKNIKNEGFSENNHLYITFKTKFPGVVIPSYLLEQYPSKIKIVLQHEFWDLNINDEAFSVSLLFNGILENLIIPFNSIYNIEDPSEQFSLDFFVDDSHDKINNNIEDNEDKIIDLSQFRKNTPKN
jgi:hypothetical protein